MMNESKIHFSDRASINALLVLEQVLGRRIFSWLLAGLKARLLGRLEGKLRSTGATSPCAVDRRENLTAEDFHRDYFARSRPVIFAGAAKAWACCQNWNLDYFSESHGESDLLIVESRGLTTRQDTAAHEFLSVRELVANIRGGGDKYLRFSPLLHENPALAGALDMNWLQKMRGQKTFGNTYYMFMGGAGKKTLLHADQPCNLFVQVYGEKAWTLFLPGDSACLYPEVTNTAYVKSPLEIERPDGVKFPLFQHARKLTAHLYPGDVMYIPPHVWHQVENLTDTIAVGYRFSSLKAALKSSFTFTLLRVLSTNPPLWKTRKYGKEDTNLIWAHAAGKINEVLAQKAARQKPIPRQNHEEVQL